MRSGKGMTFSSMFIQVIWNNMYINKSFQFVNLLQIYNIGKLVWASEGEVQEAAKKELVECFKLFENELGDKHFFGGQNLNIVDVALIPFYSWFYAMETCGNFSIVAECPHLVAWAKRCMERESVSKSLPDQYKVYTHLLELRKQHLAELKG